MLIEIMEDLCSRKFQVRSQLKLSGIRECREVGESENRACEISLARLSPRLLRRRESKRHLFVVDSLDKQMQNGHAFLACGLWLRFE